jgi:3-oxoacyl-[acyl-carrier-protein] synthase III
MAAGILLPSRWVWEVTEEQIDLLILGTTSPAQTMNEKQTPKTNKKKKKSIQIKSAGGS